MTNTNRRRVRLLENSTGTPAGVRAVPAEVARVPVSVLVSEIVSNVRFFRNGSVAGQTNPWA
ncbi:MAG: hypothetical protein LH606_20075 [Cytophagaceae bacterium]|nr:hypothetical protein [Cytophagaceae bacterium]